MSTRASDTTSRFERFLPWAGVLAGIALGGGAVLSGSEPSIEDDPASKVIAYYHDNEGALFGSAVLGGLFAVFLLFYVTARRARLRSGEGGEGLYSAAAYAGGIVTAAAVGAWSWVGAAAQEAAKGGHDEATLALGYLNDMGWLPWVVGTSVLMISTGLGALRTATLPKWFGIVSTVLGFLALCGPAGIAVFLASPFYFVTGGFVLAHRPGVQAPLAAYAD